MLKNNSYKQKYLKYKNKYLAYKNNLYQQNGGINMIYIPKNTYWFRSAPNICNYNSIKLCKENAQICNDTYKTGIYLANNILVSIAMCLEYDKLLEFGVFLLTDNIYVSNDKYEFRQINPERYWDKQNNFIPNVKINEEENISHIMCNLNLLKLNQSKTDLELLLPSEKIDELNLCELFLTKDDITKIQLIDKFKFNTDIIKSVNDLQKYLEVNDYPNNIEQYINDKILLRFTEE